MSSITYHLHTSLLHPVFLDKPFHQVTHLPPAGRITTKLPPTPHPLDKMENQQRRLPESRINPKYAFSHSKIKSLGLYLSRIFAKFSVTAVYPMVWGKPSSLCCSDYCKMHDIFSHTFPASRKVLNQILIIIPQAEGNYWFSSGSVFLKIYPPVECLGEEIINLRQLQSLLLSFVKVFQDAPALIFRENLMLNIFFNAVATWLLNRFSTVLHWFYRSNHWWV